MYTNTESNAKISSATLAQNLITLQTSSIASLISTKYNIRIVFWMFRRPTTIGTGVDNTTFLNMSNMKFQFDINNQLTWTDQWLWSGTCDKTNFGLDASNPFLQTYLTENKNKWNYYEFEYGVNLTAPLTADITLTYNINNANSNSLTCTNQSQVTVGLGLDFNVNLDNFLARNLGIFYSHSKTTAYIPNFFYLE